MPSAPINASATTPHSVPESDFDLGGAFAKPDQAMVKVHAFGWQRFSQHVEHVGAVRLILPELEMAFDVYAERRSQ